MFMLSIHLTMAYAVGWPLGVKGAEYRLAAKKLPKIGKKRDKIRKNGEKREKVEKSGRFFHFALPDRKGWLRYWAYVHEVKAWLHAYA